MQASLGDRIVVSGAASGGLEQEGEIVEIRGDEGEPPYLVRFDDGHEALILPGPGTVVRPAIDS
ncbi:DUF1918 domain-containing protein [Streptomyces sp. NPDC050698]